MYVKYIGYDFVVQITPIYNRRYKTNVVYEVSTVENGSFEIFGQNGEVFWTVFGTRQIIDVEPLKIDYKINTNDCDNPYTYLTKK